MPGSGRQASNPSDISDIGGGGFKKQDLSAGEATGHSVLAYMPSGAAGYDNIVILVQLAS
ncbi:unnamed protein product [Prunus armeniaca]|uniref:Uncharacterized protein n=1 Tax=Prunus armeniaca TaxID=36596 RepID=A0A6J5XTE7_PRUAR|nr:unnamed protein product [Prunus armeniaca]